MSETAAKYQAEQTVARAVAARSRPMRLSEPGQRVFFYRKYPKQQVTRALFGSYVGPGTVIGLHSTSSVWVQFGGRCYRCAKEHCRLPSPEEEHMDDTPLKSQIKEINRLLEDNQIEVEDLSEQRVSPGEFDTAVEQPVQAEEDTFASEAAEDYPRSPRPTRTIPGGTWTDSAGPSSW